MTTFNTDMSIRELNIYYVLFVLANQGHSLTPSHSTIESLETSQSGDSTTQDEELARN
jgi:hypothetical protein